MALVESRGLLTPATFPGIEFPEALFVSYADFFFFFPRVEVSRAAFRE